MRAGVSDRRVIECAHGLRCSVAFMAERVTGGITVSIDDIDCRLCATKIAGNDGAAAETRELLVRKITAAL